MRNQGEAQKAIGVTDSSKQIQLSAKGGEVHLVRHSQKCQDHRFGVEGVLEAPEPKFDYSPSSSWA